MTSEIIKNYCLLLSISRKTNTIIQNRIIIVMNTFDKFIKKKNNYQIILKNIIKFLLKYQINKY